MQIYISYITICINLRNSLNLQDMLHCEQTNSKMHTRHQILKQHFTTIEKHECGIKSHKSLCYLLLIKSAGQINETYNKFIFKNHGI